MKGMLRQTGLVDPFGDLQVGFAGVVEKLGEFQAYGRIPCEQQPFEHRLVDRDHLLQISSGEVHGGARILAQLDDCGDFLGRGQLCGRLEIRWRIPEAFDPKQNGRVCA